MVKEWMLSSADQEQGKDVCSHHCYIQHCTRDSSKGIRQKIKQKATRLKRKTKLSLFADNMILYKENPKVSIIETTRANKQVQQGHRTNTQKPCLYICNCQSENKIKKTTLFIRG